MKVLIVMLQDLLGNRGGGQREARLDQRRHLGRERHDVARVEQGPIEQPRLSSGARCASCSTATMLRRRRTSAAGSDWNASIAERIFTIAVDSEAVSGRSSAASRVAVARGKYLLRVSQDRLPGLEPLDGLLFGVDGRAQLAQQQRVGAGGFARGGQSHQVGRFAHRGDVVVEVVVVPG